MTRRRTVMPRFGRRTSQAEGNASIRALKREGQVGRLKGQKEDKYKWRGVTED